MAPASRWYGWTVNLEPDSDASPDVIVSPDREDTAAADAAADEVKTEAAATPKPPGKPAPARKPAQARKPAPSRKPAPARKPAASAGRTTSARKPAAPAGRTAPTDTDTDTDTGTDTQAPARAKSAASRLTVAEASDVVDAAPGDSAAAASDASTVSSGTRAPTRTATPRSTSTTRPDTAPRKPRGAGPKAETAAVQETRPAPKTAATVLEIEGLVKRFGDTVAVAGIDLTVHAGSIFGIVGPNGAGKTTTLSMVTGLLRPDAGRILIHGADVWRDPVVAKRNMGVLPDRLRLFDRLTGAQLLYYSGTLRGLDRQTVKARSADLAAAFGLEDALGRLVTDYSAGMAKKIALAAAMIHSPRILILDEPFEAVDPVSAANVIEILQKYAAAGGTVVLSSHSMDLIQRICDSVAIVVRGEILASGTTDEVRRGSTLENRFIVLAGGRKAAEGMEWLHSFSD